MDKPISDFTFRLMALTFRIRDLLRPRKTILQEVPFVPGVQVLDYGCGPGSYTIPAAESVREGGRVYALDIHPLALETVKKKAAKTGLENIQTILSDCATGLPDASIDIILLYDVFHGLNQPEEVLAELARVLKPRGVLSFNDHHLTDDEIRARMTYGGRFRLTKRGERTYIFGKTREGAPDA